MSYDELYNKRELDKIANELRKAYGLPMETELLMRPCDLIEWMDERIKSTKERNAWRFQ